MATVLSPAMAVNPVAQGIAREEFDTIVRDHQQRVYRVLMALLRDPDAAANLTQDTFVRAFEKRAQFRGEASVGTWLVHIAVNLARDHRRSRREGFWRKIFAKPAAENNDATDDQLVSVADDRPTQERMLLAREKAETVWRVVETLSPQQREVFILRFAEEMSLDEIAEALDIKLGTVKAHLSRALATVRRSVGQAEGARS